MHSSVANMISDRSIYKLQALASVMVNVVRFNETKLKMSSEHVATAIDLLRPDIVRFIYILYSFQSSQSRRNNYCDCVHVQK